ncbi:hypothetical protein F5Y06DRAFT_67132 [Hypoxylon sp. FL0890]|nr:hypothetical protein F5Y06DRAFT_67132 [Hypoxylon sp. FL0890]
MYSSNLKHRETLTLLDRDTPRSILEQTNISKVISTNTIMGNSTDQNSQPTTGFFSRFFHSSTGSFSSSGPSQETHEHEGQKAAGATTPTQSSAPTPYVPHHAKDSFLKTATSHQMKKENEIL